MAEENPDDLLRDLPPEIRDKVIARMSEATNEASFRALIESEILDHELLGLVERALSGDNTAFDMLWRRMSQLLRRTIRIHIRCRTPEDVDQAEATTMELILAKLPTYSFDKGRVLTWARSLARGVAKWYRCRPLGSAPGPDAADSAQFLPPPSDCYREMLEMIQVEEPHEVLAFLLIRFLKWKPAEVVEKFCGPDLTAVDSEALMDIWTSWRRESALPELTGPELAAEIASWSNWRRSLGLPETGDLQLKDAAMIVENQVIEQYEGLAGFYGRLTPLRVASRLLEGRTFKTCIESGRTLAWHLSRWADRIVRLNADRVIGQAKDLLEFVCSLSAPTYQRLVFLRRQFLHETVVEVMALADWTLILILAGFESDFVGLTALDAVQIGRCTRPLRDQLKKDPNRTLRECSANGLRNDIEVWCERIRRMTLDEAKQHKLLAFCYLCGSLPGVRTEKKEEGNAGKSNSSAAR